jgi:ABC-2 type transport system permease protein
VLGGCTDVLLQVVILFIFSFLFPSVDPRGIPLALLFLLGTSVARVSRGLALGSLLESLEGFQVISAFLVFPLFFLSGALFTVAERLPAWLQKQVIVNPLTYTVTACAARSWGFTIIRFPRSGRHHAFRPGHDRNRSVLFSR